MHVLHGLMELYVAVSTYLGEPQLYAHVESASRAHLSWVQLRI